MSLDRRAFLRGSLAAGSAAALSPQVAHATQAPQDAPTMRAIQRKRIPKTGELLPVIGLGTSRTLNVDPNGDHPSLVEVVQGFLDWGGSCIDSSPMYGNSESVVGELLTKIDRKDLFFATKVWTKEGKQAGIDQMEESRQRMAADRFDLMQIHNLVGLDQHMPTLEQMKAEGKIRYLGVTEMRDWETVEKLILSDKLDFVQIPYSLGERDVEARILPAARDHGVAVLVMRPFVRGQLFKQVADKKFPEWAAEIECSSWAQLFLKWLLGHPAVTCPIPATSKPHHLHDNMQGGVGSVPDTAMRARIQELVLS
jgi:diketogulonate reductase-like aldo/keto reductase